MLFGALVTKLEKNVFKLIRAQINFYRANKTNHALNKSAMFCVTVGSYELRK